MNGEERVRFAIDQVGSPFTVQSVYYHLPENHRSGGSMSRLQVAQVLSRLVREGELKRYRTTVHKTPYIYEVVA